MADASKQGLAEGLTRDGRRNGGRWIRVETLAVPAWGMPRDCEVNLNDMDVVGSQFILTICPCDGIEAIGRTQRFPLDTLIAPCPERSTSPTEYCQCHHAHKSAIEADSTGRKWSEATEQTVEGVF